MSSQCDARNLISLVAADAVLEFIDLRDSSLALKRLGLSATEASLSVLATAAQPSGSVCRNSLQRARCLAARVADHKPVAAQCAQ